MKSKRNNMRFHSNLSAYYENANVHNALKKRPKLQVKKGNKTEVLDNILLIKEKKEFDNSFKEKMKFHETLKEDNNHFLKSYQTVKNKVLEKSNKLSSFNQKDEFDEIFFDLIQNYMEKGYSKDDIKSNQNLFEPSVLLNGFTKSREIVYEKDFEDDCNYLEKLNRQIINMRCEEDGRRNSMKFSTRIMNDNENRRNISNLESQFLRANTSKNTDVLNKNIQEDEQHIQNIQELIRENEGKRKVKENLFNLNVSLLKDISNQINFKKLSNKSVTGIRKNSVNQINDVVNQIGFEKKKFLKIPTILNNNSQVNDGCKQISLDSCLNQIPQKKINFNILNTESSKNERKNFSIDTTHNTTMNQITYNNHSRFKTNIALKEREKFFQETSTNYSFQNTSFFQKNENKKKIIKKLSILTPISANSPNVTTTIHRVKKISSINKQRSVVETPNKIDFNFDKLFLNKGKNKELDELVESTKGRKEADTSKILEYLKKTRTKESLLKIMERNNANPNDILSIISNIKHTLDKLDINESCNNFVSKYGDLILKRDDIKKIKQLDQKYKYLDGDLTLNHENLRKIKQLDMKNNNLDFDLVKNINRSEKID